MTLIFLICAAFFTAVPAQQNLKLKQVSLLLVDFMIIDFMELATTLPD